MGKGMGMGGLALTRGSVSLRLIDFNYVFMISRIRNFKSYFSLITFPEFELRVDLLFIISFTEISNSNGLADSNYCFPNFELRTGFSIIIGNSFRLFLRVILQL